MKDKGRAKNDDWMIVKAVLPPGMIYRTEEQRTRNLFENDRSELSKILSDHNKRFLGREEFDRRVAEYQLTVRSERMREAGKKLLETLLNYTLAIPTDGLSAREYARWVEGYVPRTRVYSRRKGSVTLRARNIATDDNGRSYRIQTDRFSNDNEFQRAIDSMKELGIIEERGKVKHRQEATYYRIRPYLGQKVGWALNDLPIYRAKKVLVDEMIFWSGWSISEFQNDIALDEKLCRKIDDRVRSRLIEIFGEEQVQRYDRYLHID